MHAAADPQPGTRWLLQGRLLTLALLLASELVAARFASHPPPLHLVAATVFAWAALATFGPWLVGKLLRPERSAFLQILLDLLFVTATVYVTGGLDSSLHLLYPLVILCAAVLLPRPMVYLTAALAFIFYGGTLDLAYFGLLPSFSNSRPPLGTLQAVIILNLLGLLAVAYLASLLAAKLRHANAEFQRLERELRIQDRLAAVGRLASAVAHEIRNPLTSIAGSAHMLVSIHALADEHRQLLRIIVRESERLNQILSEFLDYSRERQYNFTPTDLICLLKETLTLLPNRSAAPQRGVVITTDLSVAEALTFADGDKLRQVLWNLCDNALRAMPQGGELRVGLQRDLNFWAITVADSGRGIPPETIDNIFEPFQSGFPGGTGLGLAIVYQIVQAHSGRIAVHSAPGQGTEFTLHLRCHNVGDIPASAPALAVVID